MCTAFQCYQTSFKMFPNKFHSFVNKCNFYTKKLILILDYVFHSGVCSSNLRWWMLYQSVILQSFWAFFGLEQYLTPISRFWLQQNLTYTECSLASSLKHKHIRWLANNIVAFIRLIYICQPDKDFLQQIVKTMLRYTVLYKKIFDKKNYL